MPGDLLASERSFTRDVATGRVVTRWTRSSAKDQHLYFTCPSVTADGRWLVIISERDGHPNLWAIDRDDGRFRRLTANRSGSRRCYCHPHGGATGLAKTTPCLDAVRGRVYAVIDDRVRRVDLAAGSQRDLGPLPTGAGCSFAHVSPDGATLILAVSDEAVYADPAPTQAEQMERVWTRVQRGEVRSRLIAYDTTHGGHRVLATVPFWVTHVQYDPTGSGRVLFNSEGHWRTHAVIPRMWMLDPDGGTRPLFAQPPDEPSGHEAWTADGMVLYHGHGRDGSFVARRAADGRLIERLALPDLPIHHATPLPDGMLVDTTDGWVQRIRTAGPGPVTVERLCRHDLRDATDQDHHVHAIATPDGRSAVFATDRDGTPDVYEIALD